MPEKMKKSEYIFGAILFLILFSLVANLVMHNMKTKNRMKRYFCVRETLNRIIRDQYEYITKFDKYANFTDLAEFSQDDIVQKLAKTAQDGVATRYGYNYYIYLLHKNTHSPIHFFGATEPPSNILCYAWPKDEGAGNHAFAIDINLGIFQYRNTNNKYIGNHKPSFDALLIGVNESWVYAGGDIDLVHEELKKRGYTCD